GQCENPTAAVCGARGGEGGALPTAGSSRGGNWTCVSGLGRVQGARRSCAQGGLLQGGALPVDPAEDARPAAAVVPGPSLGHACGPQAALRPWSRAPNPDPAGPATATATPSLARASPASRPSPLQAPPRTPRRRLDCSSSAPLSASHSGRAACRSAGAPRARLLSARFAGRRPHPGLGGPRGCHGSGVAAGARAGPEAGGRRSPRTGRPYSQRLGAIGQRRRHVPEHRGAGLGDGKRGGRRGPLAASPRRGAGWRKGARGRRPPVTAAIVSGPPAPARVRLAERRRPSPSLQPPLVPRSSLHRPSLPESPPGHCALAARRLRSRACAEPATAVRRGDDSLSAITFDSDSETKAKRKSFHRPPPTSPTGKSGLLEVSEDSRQRASREPNVLNPPEAVAGKLKARYVVAWEKPFLLKGSVLEISGAFNTTRLSRTVFDLLKDIAPHGFYAACACMDQQPPPSSTPDDLTEAERMQRSNLRRSASHGYVPGTPVYREKEGMYDEIIELKKSLHVQKSNVDLMRTKLRRLEEENSRKDRQIEQLLDPSRGPDFVRTLAEKRPDTGWVISGLKQRILKLEQQCKEKNHTIDKLQTDMKTTNLEEMRIAMETYYEEIHRLQTLLASSETTGKKPPVEKNIGLKRQKRMSSALLSLSRSVQELTEENQSLKEDLDHVLSDSPTVSKIKACGGDAIGPCSRREVWAEGARRDSCTKGARSVEWSKPRLLRRIAELEKKISLMESPKSHASEVVRSTPPAHSVSSPTVHRQPRPDRQEESERLRGVVKILKGERKALHTRLQERDLEVKQLLQTKADLEKELENRKEGEKEGREREEALREEIQALTRKFQELEESKKGGEEDPEETSPETREAPRPPGPSQTDSELDTSEGGSSWPRSGCSEGRRDAAARLLQRRWKGHQRRKKQAALHEDSPEPRVPSPVVQAEGDPWQEEAITIIQSAFRAHLARAGHRAGRQRGEQRGDRGGSGSRERSAEAMGARGAGSPAALLCGALSLGAAARRDSARGGRELR
ncbi:hypothetical protein EI555_002488, partial [Monodon monoceros]